MNAWSSHISVMKKPCVLITSDLIPAPAALALLERGNHAWVSLYIVLYARSDITVCDTL